MTGTTSRSLGLGDPYHVGIAVWDLDEAMQRLGGALGVERWGTMDAEVPSSYRGEDTLAGLRTAFARAGGWYLELVQPTGGRSTPQTFLDERGEGIYHLGYWADDIADAVRRADDLGIAVDMSMPAAEVPMAVYLDAAPTVGIHIELVNSAVRPMIEKLFTPS